MCIGIPMKVLAVEPGFAQVVGRGEARRVSTLLVGDCVAGQWLLVFLNDAREVIDAGRAQEVNATLDLLQSVIDTGVLVKKYLEDDVMEETEKAELFTRLNTNLLSKK